MTTASVIVCTYHRNDLLGATLESILADPSTADRELVVVDNAPNDETAGIVAALQPRNGVAGIRYLAEPRRGKSNALNLSVREAKGQYLLFTDDDVLVQPGWADALVAGFKDPLTGIVGGRTVPLWPEPPAAWLDERNAPPLGIRDLGDDERAILPREVIGANLAIRADIIAGIDVPFDPALGPSGNRKVDYEEEELVTRLSQTHAIHYVPDAVVHHRISAARMRWDFIRRITYQRGFGSAWQRVNYRGEALPILPRRIVRAFRTGRAARSVRRRNEAVGASTAEQAREEFEAYFEYGNQLGLLLIPYPRLTDRALGWLD